MATLLTASHCLVPGLVPAASHVHIWTAACLGEQGRNRKQENYQPQPHRNQFGARVPHTSCPGYRMVGYCIPHFSISVFVTAVFVEHQGSRSWLMARRMSSASNRAPSWPRNSQQYSWQDQRSPMVVHSS